MSEPSSNPCSACSACCRSYIVPVTGHDLWRLARAQRLDPAQFLVATPRPEATPWTFLLHPGGTNYWLVLDKRGRVGPRQPCVFLISLADGLERCGVYADRPAVCRAYPMTLESGRVVVRSQALCPPESWPVEVVANPRWHGALRALQMQFEIYAEVMARWNSRVRAAPADSRFSLHELFSFLLNVYDRLAALEAALEPQELIAVRDTWGTIRPGNEGAPTLLAPDPDLPWIAYFARALALIDGFFPQVPASSLGDRSSSSPPVEHGGAGPDAPESGQTTVALAALRRV